MELSLIAFGFGMASIFGLIVGIFSVWNGRMTRREISKLIDEGRERTGQLIVESRERTENLIMEMHRDTTESFRKMDERTAKMDERSIEHGKILREVQASAERIEETQRYVAELVRIEGEKIRSAVGH